MEAEFSPLLQNQSMPAGARITPPLLARPSWSEIAGHEYQSSLELLWCCCGHPECLQIFTGGGRVALAERVAGQGL